MSGIMADGEHSCRICRGEATLKQPLIHPCKCRGSIRYIHEDCLLEWLKHSSKSTKQCDICNTPYQFKTIYDPNMPNRVPLLLIWNKILDTVTNALITYILVVLYLAFVLQLPIFWKVIGRVYTFVVDGPLPHGSNVAQSLLYGTAIAYEENLAFGPDETWYRKAVHIFFNTFLNGVVHVAAFVIMLLAIFVEHEWVVRDEGYTKMLLNDIGTEPRSKLLDLLEGLQRRETENANNEAGNENENDENPDNARAAQRNRTMRLDLVNEAIRDLQNVPDQFPRQAELHEALHNGVLDPLINGADQAPNLPGGFDLEAPQPLPDMPANHVHPSSEANDDNADPHEGIDLANTPNPHQADENVSDDDSADEDYVYNEDNASESGSDSDLNASIEDPHAQNIAWEQDNIAEEEQDVAADNAQGMAAAFDAQQMDDLDEGILEIIGLKLNISTPLLLTIFVDVVVMIFLFAAYLIPHMVGNFVLFIVALSYQHAVQYFAHLGLEKLVPGFIYTVYNFAHGLYAKSELLTNTRFFVFDVFLQPLTEVVSRCLTLTQKGPTTLPERMVALSIGYLIGCYGIHSAMRNMISGKKPIVGTARKIYKVLFEVTATAKVFVVFAVEIVVFPVYCGWLIDMCLTPIFKNDLKVNNKDGSTVYEYLFVASIESYNSPSARVLIYWGFGTIYMLCFALYVGMLRNNVLRPGVLFFIRSPEDPNARLIHDALVKSLRFQLLRIWLSAKFYTGNILLGIGLVTWGLRWFTMSPDSEKRIFLPVPLTWEGILHVIAFGRLAKENHAMLADFCVKFWKRVFDVVCYKLRLSDFILSKPVPEERGFIVYKSWFHEFRGDLPDYSHPVTLSEAKHKLKEEPNTTACFVPDGNYVRAPSSDTSRKFIDQLFIPVTKADQPLQEPEPKNLNHEDGYESDYSDVDLNYENSYDIVYRPPDFRSRCILLVLLLGVFAQLLFVFVGVSAAFAGRLIVNVLAMAFDASGLPWHPYQIDHARVDLQSVAYGLTVIVGLLSAIDGRPMLPAQNPIPVQAPAINIDVKGWFFTSSWIPFFLHTSVAYKVTGNVFAAEPALFGTKFAADPMNPNRYAVALHAVLFLIAWSPVFISGRQEKKEQPFWKFLWNAAVFDDIVFHVAVMWFESHYVSGLARLIACVTVFTIVKVVFAGSRLLETLNDQVKNEKYVRGTAVQNIDMDDGSTE